MGSNILFLSVLCLLIFKTTAVQICTNQSTSSKQVKLNLNKGTGVSGCNCSVKLNKPNSIGSVKPKIIFETVNFTGCKYKLVISYNNTNSIMSCSNNNSVYYDINKSDEIKLYLESATSQDETTMFEVNITSSVSDGGRPFIRLECLLPTTTTTTTQETTTASPQETTMTSTQILTQKFMSTSTQETTITSTQETTIPSTQETTITSTQVSIQESSSTSTKESTPTPTSNSTTTLTPTSTQESTSTSTKVSTTANDMNETNTEGVTKPGGDDIDIGIIGGAVGGGLLLIIVIIIIIVCVVKKRRKKNHEKSDYNRPTVTESQHDYTDIDLGDNGNNSSSRQSDNTDQKANSPVEIEIIENDLYVSSNDIMDPKSRDNNNTNQTTDANNGPVEMEIIENDLYVSSSEALNSTSHDNNGPLYAEVNKKPKSGKSDQTDKSKGIAVYTDSDLGAKSNNLSSRQSDNTEQNTNSPVENQKTDANNDLYVSSSEALNSHDNDGPHYSSVNKKPKPPISNHADNSNGITGEDHHDTLL